MVFGRVVRSILSYNVHVGYGTTIKDSVIMPNVTIGNNVTIERAIIASDVVLEDGSVIGSSGSSQNITLIGDKQRLSANMREVL